MTTDTSLPSTLPKSQQQLPTVKFNVVRKEPQVNGSVIKNEHVEHEFHGMVIRLVH